MAFKEQKSIFISILFLIGITLIFAYAAVSISPNNDGSFKQYALVFSPNEDHNHIFRQIIKSDGRLVRDGTFNFIKIAASNSPNFHETIKKNGAIFVFSPIVRGGCFIKNKGRFKKE